MTIDQKHTLSEALEGTTADLWLTMRSLHIPGLTDNVRDELADTIRQCPRCHRWRDAALFDDGCGRCIECEDRLHPEVSRPD